jgi:hypothetical protein
MSATKVRPARRWTRPADDVKAKEPLRNEQDDTRLIRNSQEAFERALARELLGDCC